MCASSSQLTFQRSGSSFDGWISAPKGFKPWNFMDFTLVFHGFSMFCTIVMHFPSFSKHAFHMISSAVPVVSHVIPRPVHVEGALAPRDLHLRLRRGGLLLVLLTGRLREEPLDLARDPRAAAGVHHAAPQVAYKRCQVR